MVSPDWGIGVVVELPRLGRGSGGVEIDLGGAGEGKGRAGEIIGGVRPWGSPGQKEAEVDSRLHGEGGPSGQGRKAEQLSFHKVGESADVRLNRMRRWKVNVCHNSAAASIPG